MNTRALAEEIAADVEAQIKAALLNEREVTKNALAIVLRKATGAAAASEAIGRLLKRLPAVHADFEARFKSLEERESVMAAREKALAARMSELEAMVKSVTFFPKALPNIGPVYPRRVEVPQEPAPPTDVAQRMQALEGRVQSMTSIL